MVRRKIAAEGQKTKTKKVEEKSEVQVEHIFYVREPKASTKEKTRIRRSMLCMKKTILSNILL